MNGCLIPCWRLRLSHRLTGINDEMLGALGRFGLYHAWWLTRGWWVLPYPQHVLIWGHAHKSLMGQGLKVIVASGYQLCLYSIHGNKHTSTNQPCKWKRHSSHSQNNDHIFQWQENACACLHVRSPTVQQHIMVLLSSDNTRSHMQALRK